MHTWFVMRRYDEVLRAHGLIKGYVYVVSLFSIGREREALDTAARQVKEGNRVAPLVEAGWMRSDRLGHLMRFHQCSSSASSAPGSLGVRAASPALEHAARGRHDRASAAGDARDLPRPPDREADRR